MINAHRLLKLNRQVQADYVRNYLAAMRSDAYGPRRVLTDMMLAPPDGSVAAPVDVLARKKARRQLMASVIGERVLDGQVRVRDEMVALHRGYSQIHQRRAQ